MKFLKDILARVFALWALLVFSLPLLVIWFPVWLVSRQLEPKRTINAFKIFNPWLTFFFVFTGVKRRIFGTEHFRKGESYVVICNHNCFMDVPLSSSGIPVPNRTIAKAEMAKIPFFNVIYKGGSILVDRKSEASRKKSYVQMRKALNMGLTVCLYPEGTRNRGNEPLLRFHDGAFRLAVDSKKEIIPAVLIDTLKVMPRNKSFYFWPHPIQMHFLPPISSIGKTTEELKEEAFQIMRDYYVKHSN